MGGIGQVSGVDCLITANESTVKGGAINESGLKKSLRLAEISTENRLPAITLAESAGADLPNQARFSRREERLFVP